LSACRTRGRFITAARKFTVDAHALFSYICANTGKEVILKYMSSYHSEVAAA
jgi:hypothetical protein